MDAALKEQVLIEIGAMPADYRQKFLRMIKTRDEKFVLGFLSYKLISWGSNARIRAGEPITEDAEKDPADALAIIRKDFAGEFAGIT